MNNNIYRLQFHIVKKLFTNIAQCHPVSMLIFLKMLTVEGTTVDNSQLGNNAATRVISVLYNHSLA